MDSKLTLKLKRDVIEKAKKYAAENRQSLSRMVENYLQNLVDSKAGEPEITPFVKSLSIKIDVPEETDTKKEYHEHQNKKHQ